MIDHASPLVTGHSSLAFYVVGGTLLGEARCYVVRQADDGLHAALSQGHFCYVLTSRQMGKSSLMVRTAARLREEGVGVAVLDLTAIGQNLSAEQWYDGLVSLIADHLDLEDELDEFWATSYRLGPMQRWMRAIREAVLPRYPGRVVIFIDEIDAVRSLPFSTDEFFAGIREFYNRRTQDPELMRLTFCLLGVASPSDLIRDTRTTPFNIGRRIELTDFTEAEAETLARGLEREEKTSAALLKRILHWTDGHPYLTQRLCQAAAEDASVNDAEGIDRLCEELFLSHRARERDDNLLFVRERLLRSETDLAALLGLYGQVRERKRVPDDETSPLVSILRLSGITKVANGHLQVRNRIYSRVFDSQWVKTNMPDAELRRQRAAYRRGLLRAAVVGAVVITLIAALAIVAVKQRIRAEQATSEALGQQKISKSRELAAHSIALLPSDPELSLVLATEGLERFAYTAEAEDALRQSLLESHIHLVLRGHKGVVVAAAYSPDGRLIVTASADHTARLWEAETGRLLSTLVGHTNWVYSVAFSPDGRSFVTTSFDKTARLWDASTGRCLAVMEGHTDNVHSPAFSPDGKLIVTCGVDGTARVWDSVTGRNVTVLRGHMGEVRTAVFSPGGEHVVTTGFDRMARVWDVKTWKTVAVLEGHTDKVLNATFSPDGKWLVTVSNDKTGRVWRTGTWQSVAVLSGHEGGVNNAAFSTDGKLVATSSGDGTSRIWEASTWQTLRELHGHTSGLRSIAFSPDGKLAVTASEDGTARVWNTDTGESLKELRGHTAGLLGAMFSPDGNWVLTVSGDNTARIWDVSWGKPRTEMYGQRGPLLWVTFSPDGKLVATASVDGTARLWDANTGQSVTELRGHTNWVSSAAFSPDGRFVVTASRDKTARVWDVTTGQSLRELRGHTHFVASAAYSPDGKFIITGSSDGTALVWDASTGESVRELRGHDDEVGVAVFSPDGKLAATASHDATARVWDVNTGQGLLVLRGHTSWVLGLAFSPDGKFIVTGSSDCRVWDATTGQGLLVLGDHKHNIHSVAYSPDGEFIVTGSEDGTTRVWKAETGQPVEQIKFAGWGVAFSPDGRFISTVGGGAARIYPCEVCRPLEELIALAHARVTRQLTPDERQKYLNESPGKQDRNE